MTDTTERLRELALDALSAMASADACQSGPNGRGGVRAVFDWESKDSNYNAVIVAHNALPDLRAYIDHLTAALDEANARADRMQEALQNIAAEAERENGGWVHLKRSIAINARAALATPPNPDKRAAALSDLAALDGESL
jgi:hypothetical protein